MSKLHSMVPFRVALLGLALVALSSSTLVQNYCSNENTGSGYAAVLDLYQSNGACYDQCKSQYAFAIVQYKSCWCSNYLPADQQSVGSCDQTCPGFPGDKCGNVAAGLYGYIALPNAPSGTIGAPANSPTGNTYASYGTQPFSSGPPQPYSPTSASTFTSPAPTSYVSQTIYQTVTQSQGPSTVVSYVTPTPSTTPDEATSTPLSAISSSTTAPVIVPVAASTEVVSDPPTATVTPTPVTSVRVVTVSGAMVTQTVTSTPSVAAASNPDDDSTKLQRKGLSGGAIAGAVIGTLLGVAALILGACLLWRRKKRQADTEVGANQGMKRNTSVLSRTGLLVRNRPISMAENNADDPLYVNTGTGNNSVRHSMLFGSGAMAGEGVSPVSPLGSATEQGSSQRYSRPLVYDQRLNPSALFANAEGNGSRISIQDQQDYSRPLGIMNPDPRISTDSRP